MKMYITKYALSAGIKKLEGAMYDDNKYFGSKSPHFSWLDYYVIGKDAFPTMAEAKVDAEVRRDKKITSLKKQADKLQKLTFEEAE